MKNMKKFMAVMAVASLVATSTITVSAFEYEGPQGEVTGTTDADKEAEANGHTTFSVIEAVEGTNPTNVSFTVPLYVTMAVVGGEQDLYTPSNYEIRNTSQDAMVEDPVNIGDFIVQQAAYDIAVIGMNFEKLVDSTYNTVASDSTSTEPTDMVLSIGGVVMPPLSTPSASEVTLTTGVTSFFDGVDFDAIAPNAVRSLPILAKLQASAVVSANNAAVPQFKVKYTVAPVLYDEDGENPFVLAVYAGDDSIAAGLGIYDVDNKVFK